MSAKLLTSASSTPTLKSSSTRSNGTPSRHMTIILHFSYVSTGVVYVNGLCCTAADAPQDDEAVTLT